MSKKFIGLELGTALVMISILGVLAVILVPVFRSAQAAATRTRCMSNLKGLAYRVSLYASDYDDRLPDAAQWTEQVRPYLGSESFSCLSGPGLDYTYAMATAVSRQRLHDLAEPRMTPLLFDSIVMMPNAHGNLDILPDPPRHSGANFVVYADGNAQSRRKTPAQEAKSGGE